MHPRIRTLLAVLFAFAATSSALAQCLVSTTPRGTGAVDGGRAIVTDGELGFPPHVHFYEKTEQGWRSQERHVIGDLETLIRNSVAIDGDRAIAGSPESTTVAGQVFLGGRAFVFDRVGDHWISTELIPTTSHEMDLFGAWVAIDGDVALVGAPHYGPYGDGHARTHVFEFDGTSWSEVAQLTPFATQIDVEGDTIVLGDDGQFPGRVYVYEKVAGLWTLAQTLLGPTLPGGPYLGSSVALQGDTLAVGAVPMTSIGGCSVQIFRRLANGWRPEQRILPHDSAPGDAFGTSVALSGSTLLVGAPGAGDAGAVYRFEHDGTSFVESGKIDPEPGIVGIGSKVALHREDAIFSAYPDLLFYRLGFAQQTSFCPTTPNSTGSSGTLRVEGCDSVGGQRLSLLANGLPPSVLGLFFFGGSTTQVPFGNGFRCVGEPLFRLSGGTTDRSGHLLHDVDFTSSPGSQLTSGRTWHFQAFHRDPGSAGAQLNLTNALSIGITP